MGIVMILLLIISIILIVVATSVLGPVYTIFAAPVRPQTSPIKARGA